MCCIHLIRVPFELYIYLAKSAFSLKAYKGSFSIESMRVRARYGIGGALMIFIIITTIIVTASMWITLFNEAAINDNTVKEQVENIVLRHIVMVAVSTVVWIGIVIYLHYHFDKKVVKLDVLRYVCISTFMSCSIIFGIIALAFSGHAIADNLLIQSDLKDGDVDLLKVVLSIVMGVITAFILPLVILAAYVGKIEVVGRRIRFVE